MKKKNSIIEKKRSTWRLGAQ